MKITVLLTFIIFSHVKATILPFLSPPKHDGIQRVCKLTVDNFTTTVETAEVAIVVFEDPLKDIHQSNTPRCPCELDKFAEISAQLLRKKNIIVCTAPSNIITSTSQTASTNAIQYNPGDVYIFKNGKGKPYYGDRSAPSIIGYLFKVNSTQVKVITGKLDKIAFDGVQENKVVGFFMQTAADYLAFEEAAANLSPSVQFYAVFDRTVAKHLKLDTVGQIHLIKSLSKTPILCPQNPATAADIEALVTQTKGASLRKIDNHNLYDPQLLDATKMLVLAIGEESSAVGGYFYRLVTKLVRNNTNNTEFEKLNLIWIEPKNFPTIHMMMDELETSLGIPNKLPAFGTVNITTLQSSWLDTASINTTADKTADEKNVQILQEFLSGVINNTILPVKLGIQNFVQPPTPKIVEDGSEVILECIVENKIGDCLWLKDGRNIGFNLARYPTYSWGGDITAGDCSLKISAVQKGKDDGEWICEVTGDLENPTLSSLPVKLLIQNSQTTGQNAEL